MLLIPAIDLKDGHCVRLKRGEMRFESAEALVEEMHRDVERTRAICAGR